MCSNSGRDREEYNIALAPVFRAVSDHTHVGDCNSFVRISCQITDAALFPRSSTTQSDLNHMDTKLRTI